MSSRNDGVRPGWLLAALRVSLAEAIVPLRHHPAPEELVGYARGELGGFLHDAVQRHLTFCPVCVPVVLDLAAGRRVRRAPVVPSGAAGWTPRTLEQWTAAAAAVALRRSAAEWSDLGLGGPAGRPAARSR